MTHLLRLAEGLSDDVTPADVWAVALMRREVRRSELMALATSFCASISVNFSGGSTAEVVRPFYTRAEWDRIESRRDEEAQRIAQAQQIAKLRRMSRNG